MQSMRDIVGKCLIKDASKRPSAAQLLEHKFFKVGRRTDLSLSVMPVLYKVPFCMQILFLV